MRITKRALSLSLDTVTKQRDALLEACKLTLAWMDDGADHWSRLREIVEPSLRAAIALCQPDPSSYETPSEVGK